MTVELTPHRLSDGDGPQLVFLHALGALTSGRYANELAGLLNESCGAGVVGLDAPGFGDSPVAARDEYEVSGYAAVVAGSSQIRQAISRMWPSWAIVIEKSARVCTVPGPPASR